MMSNELLLCAARTSRNESSSTADNPSLSGAAVPQSQSGSPAQASERPAEKRATATRNIFIGAGSLDNALRHHRDQLPAEGEPVIDRGTVPEFFAGADALFHQENRDTALVPQHVRRVDRLVVETQFLAGIERGSRD